MGKKRELSLPSWERGLKLYVTEEFFVLIVVAPFVGAWIETFIKQVVILPPTCRSLRGSVD